jgi:hypothetical protein
VIGTRLVKDDNGHLVKRVQARRPDQRQPQLAVIADAVLSRRTDDLELRG